MTNVCLKNTNISTSKDVAIYIAERIKIARKEHHLSLQDVSQKLGISRKQLQNYESAKSNITVVRLWEIASLMNVNPSFFIEGLSKNHQSISNEDLLFLYKLHRLRNKTAQKALICLLNDL